MQVADKTLEKPPENKCCRPRDQQEQQQGAAQYHIDPAQQLNAPVHAADRGNQVDQHQPCNGDQLHGRGIRGAVEGAETVADLQAQESNGPDRAREHRQNGHHVGNIPQGASDAFFPGQGKKQGAGCQGQASVVVQAHQYDGGQAAQDGPGEKTPVQERLGQCNGHGLG